MAKPSIAAQCLELSGLFEAELLLELMLRYWGHPFADDSEFREQLLETAVENIRLSISGRELMEDIPPDQMNLVLAIWYSEWNSAQPGENEHREERTEWLEKVRRAIPSCFCDQSDLDGHLPPDGA